MGKEGAKELLLTLNDIFQKREVVITDINPENRGDAMLALQACLRGKSAGEYTQIVNGLFRQMHQIKDGDKAEWNRLLEIVSGVMSLGERDLGIDWS